MKSRYRIIVVCILAIFTSLINILPVIISLLHTPDGFINLLTGHYFADYFTYIQAIASGSRGAWVLENPYSAGETSYLYGWWPYLLLGKIASFFSMSAVAIYWLAVLVMSFGFIIGAYVVIQKMLSRETFVVQLSGLIVFLFSAPLVKLQETVAKHSISYYDYWYVPNVLFRRLGNIPYHLISSVATLALLYGIAHMLDSLHKMRNSTIISRAVLVGIMLTLLMTFAPFNAMLVVFAGIATFLITATVRLYSGQKGYLTKGVLYWGIIVFVVGISAIFLKSLMLGSGPLLRASLWERSLAPFYPNPFEVIQIMGVVLIGVPLGLMYYQKHRSTLAVSGIMFVLIGFVSFYSPLASLIGSHHWRFLNPVIYVYLAALSVAGIKWAFKNNRAVVAWTIFILMISLPVHIAFLRTQITDPNLHTKISRIPRDIEKAFVYLDSQEGEGNVLTAPHEYMGLLVPIFTRRQVFLAREISTADFAGRVKVADDFYSGRMDAGSARAFLDANKIRFVFLSRIDNYSRDLNTRYPFLKKKYESRNAMVFEYIK